MNRVNVGMNTMNTVSRKSREASPINANEYANIRGHIGNRKYVILGPPLPPNQLPPQQQNLLQIQQQPGFQVPPQHNQLQIQQQQNLHLPQAQGHPFLRRLGYLGLIGGLGAAGYRYRDTIKKLGQKAINYATDKFHNLFNPPNSTQSENRQIF